MYWMTFPWPWPKVTAVASISKNLLVCAMKDHYKTFQLCCPSHGHYLIRFWGNSVENCYFGKFSLKISDLFFQGQTLFWPYLRNGWSDWCETKREYIGWILGTMYDLDRWPSLMTLTLDVSRSNFEIALSPELLVWLMWNEKEVSWYDTGPIVWPCPLTTPMTLTLEFQGQSLK